MGGLISCFTHMFNKFGGKGKGFGGGGFNKGGFGGGRGGFRKGGFGDRGQSFPSSMHKATCAECGSPCEVPFKPNGRKPVLCSNCFKKDDQGGRFERRPSRGSFGEERSYTAAEGARARPTVSNEQFEILNDKLNMILELLNDDEK